MTARVRVVDDVDTNVKLLEARLAAEYFEVRTAKSGPEALQICARERADVILLDVMMPGMDGFEVCRKLKSDPRTQHVPVIMVTALDQPSDRVRGLEAGADDFLTKPVDDIALITRVRNVARLKMLTDEMLMRASTEEQMGFAATLGVKLDQLGRGGRILLVEDRDRSAERIIEALKDEHHVEREADPARAVAPARRPFRSFDRKPEPRTCRRAETLLAGSFARPHQASADHDHHRTGRGYAPAARSRHGRQRLYRAARRSQRAVGAGAYPGEAQALYRPFADAARGNGRNGDPRSAHRAA